MGDIFSLQGLSHGGTMMFEKMIEDLKSKILEAVERYLKSHEKAPQKKIRFNQQGGTKGRTGHRR